MQHDATRETDASQAVPGSDRYELDDLFPEEGPETRHLLKVAGIVLLVALLLLALGYPLKFL